MLVNFKAMISTNCIFSSRDEVRGAYAIPTSGPDYFLAGPVSKLEVMPHFGELYNI